MDFIKDITVEKQDNSSVKITGEVPFAELEKHRTKAIAHIGKDMEVDGFRKGHVPAAKIVERVGEMTILGEMAERALAEVYPHIIKEHELEVIGHPQISITKIAEGNPLGFTAEVAVMPEITLPDYKKIAAAANKERTSDDVTDEDVEKQIEDVLRQKVAYERMQELAQKKAEAEAAAPETGDATELPTPESEAQKKAEAEEVDPSKLELPELTDELVKTLGQPGQFETVDDFKAKIREHLEIEKKQEAVAKHRAQITDTIIDQSEMALPEVLVESEITQMFGQMNEDLKRANLKMEDYLSHIKKTKEELEAEWRPAAEKRAKLQLVLNEIAKTETITPDKEALDAQVKELLEQYKDADETRVRVYVASVMMNEAVMEMLEEIT